MDDVAVVGVIQCSEKLDCEFFHDWIWYHVSFEQCTKAAQCFTHDIKDKADMNPIGPAMFKVIHKVADVLVSTIQFVVVPEMLQDLPLLDWLFRVIGLGAQNFKCEVLAIIGIGIGISTAR